MNTEYSDPIPNIKEIKDILNTIVDILQDNSGSFIQWSNDPFLILKDRISKLKEVVK